MNEYQKLEYLHSELSELINGTDGIDLHKMQEVVEDIREKYFDNKGNLIESGE